MPLSKDRESFGSIYDSYAPAVFGEIMRIVNDQETAEKLLKEVFMTVWHEADHYDPSKARLFTWIISMTRHHCSDHLSKTDQHPANMETGNCMIEIEVKQHI